MSQPPRQISKILASLGATGTLQEEKVIALIVAIRRLIELESKRTSFPTLWFYCNWCLHSQIERGLTREWLTKVSQAMSELPTDAWYTDKIAKIMALDVLRAELLALFRNKNLALFLFESASNWRAFVRMICAHILGTPLVREDRTPPDSNHRFWVLSLRLGVVCSDPILDPVLANPKVTRGAIYFIIHAVYDDIENKFPPSPNPNRDITIFGQVSNPELDSAFPHP